MLRIVTSMQAEIAQDDNLDNRSYSGLILRLSEPDLVREFAALMKESVAALGADDPSCEFSFSLAPVDLIDSNTNDFAASTALFKHLCSSPDKVLVRAVSSFTKDFFMNPLEDAFKRARIDSAEARKMMPHARRALNVELLQFYGLLARENGIVPLPQIAPEKC